MSLPYDSAVAFGQAVSDRLRRAAADSPFSVDELHARFVYDRLLARVFNAAPEEWVLKGATVLLARLPQARHTRDVDLWLRHADAHEALSRLQAAADTDLGDFFAFTLRDRGPISGRGIRAGRAVHVQALIGGQPYHAFRVDIATSLVVTGKPERVAPIAPVDLPGLRRVDDRAYPLADHVADKVCGLLAPTTGGEARHRFRDLADLVLMAEHAELDAAAVRLAVSSQLADEGLERPARFTVPDSPAWRPGYAVVAQAIPGVPDNLDDAARTVRALLDPVLDGTAVGRWDARRGAWSGREIGRTTDIGRRKARDEGLGWDL